MSPLAHNAPIFIPKCPLSFCAFPEALTAIIICSFSCDTAVIPRVCFLLIACLSKPIIWTPGCKEPSHDFACMFPWSKAGLWQFLQLHMPWFLCSTKDSFSFEVKYNSLGFPAGSHGIESACNAGDPGSIPASWRSSGEENGTHSSILVWRIPWTGEPGGL